MICQENDEKKIYRQIHSKKYYEKHKERILKKITCSICGGSYATTNLKNHQNSKKHKKCLEIMNNYKKEIDAVINKFIYENK